eukprot:TRINITY_DN4539_c0_g1_i2.p1 TRINITY_DN4539_c0_g1~~TRINITY_DN4539_c0_g1_i2.p1  ORF type:complete len:597 (-),score=34.01 TRINITY_DN4539_c0_g1_i2:57-1847(-)
MGAVRRKVLHTIPRAPLLCCLYFFIVLISCLLIPGLLLSHMLILTHSPSLALMWTTTVKTLPKPLQTLFLPAGAGRLIDAKYKLGNRASVSEYPDMESAVSKFREFKGQVERHGLGFGDRPSEGHEGSASEISADRHASMLPDKKPRRKSGTTSSDSSVRSFTTDSDDSLKTDPEVAVNVPEQRSTLRGFPFHETLPFQRTEPEPSIAAFLKERMENAERERRGVAKRRKQHLSLEAWKGTEFVKRVENEMMAQAGDGSDGRKASSAAIRGPGEAEPDEELFARALAVDSWGRSSAGIPKIAFLFITRGPLPLAPLWTRFFRGNEVKFSIHVHTEPSYDEKEFDSNVPPVFRGRRIQSPAEEWGPLSFVKAELRLLAHSLLDPLNRFMLVLSESCIPLFPFMHIYNYITASPSSFVTITPCPNAQLTWNPILLPQVHPKNWRKGDAWKELHRELAAVILSDQHFRPKFMQHFGCHDCVLAKVRGFIDERYVPTLLYTKMGHLLANRTLTWVDWRVLTTSSDEVAMFPPTYEAVNITRETLVGIRSKTRFVPFGNPEATAIECRQNSEPVSCYMFARKFSARCLTPLLMLAESVFGY